MISAFVLNPTTGALTLVPGSPFNERLDPYALAVDPAGKFLFVANNSTSDVSVFAINQTSGALTEAPNSPTLAAWIQSYRSYDRRLRKVLVRWEHILS